MTRLDKKEKTKPFIGDETRRTYKNDRNSHLSYPNRIKSHSHDKTRFCTTDSGTVVLKLRSMQT